MFAGLRGIHTIPNISSIDVQTTFKLQKKKQNTQAEMSLFNIKNEKNLQVKNMRTKFAKNLQSLLQELFIL